MAPNTTLNVKVVRELRESLEARLIALQAALDALMRERRNGDGDRSGDAAVWASEALEDELQLARANRQSEQRLQVQHALDRLERGEYGICRDCEEFIGVTRLRALPFAQRCSPCQAHHERRQRGDIRQARPAGVRILLDAA